MATLVECQIPISIVWGRHLPDAEEIAHAGSALSGDHFERVSSDD